MSDFGQSLLSAISKNFNSRIKQDRTLRSLANRVRDGTSYEDAQRYAERLGKTLSRSINAETETLSYMSEEVAREVLNPLLEYDHELIGEAVRSVQTNMNEEAGVGLTPTVPEFDSNRADDLAKKIASYENMEDARWLLNEPIINFSEAIVDQAVRDNAKKSSDAGLEARIVRVAEPAGIRTRRIGKKTYSYQIPCEWCSNLAGSWEYGNEPEDVYRRHAFCRCVLTYKIQKSVQDVWSKKYWIEEDAKSKQEQISEMEQRLITDRAKLNEDKLVHSLTVTHTGARKILADYKDEIARDGLPAVIDKLIRNQNLLNSKYRSRR